MLLTVSSLPDRILFPDLGSRHIYVPKVVGNLCPGGWVICLPTSYSPAQSGIAEYVSVHTDLRCSTQPGVYFQHWWCRAAIELDLSCCQEEMIL